MSVEEWLQTPLDVVDRLLDDATAQGSIQSFAPQLACRAAISPVLHMVWEQPTLIDWPDLNVPQVPSLNNQRVEYLAPFSLVRFRCMVQDAFDPEYYHDAFEEVHTETGQRVRSLFTLLSGIQFALASADNAVSRRHSAQRM
jgi:hypothetical protein